MSTDTEAMGSALSDSGRKTPARLAGSAILACQSDERLVKLMQDGHERAFEAIVSRYRKPLVRYSARILPESRTEDAVQQAFINAHAALLAGEQPAQLKPWLYTITRNAALNMVRQNGWNYEQIPLDFDGVRRPDQVVEQRIELQKTVAAVNDLPDRQREAIVMREFEGRSYDEIALALGANDGAVRQLLNRARGTLRAAASAFIPPPLVTRAIASMPPSDGRRVAEVVGGLGAMGIAKAGATVLVAGSLVVGAANAPLHLRHRDGATAKKATLVDNDSAASAAVADVAAGTRSSTGAAAPSAGSSPAAAKRGRSRNRGRSNSGGSSGPGPSGSRDGGGSDDRRGSEGSDDRSGSSERHSQPDDSTTRSGSGRGSDDSSKSGSGGSGSGTSGSDDSGSGSSGSGGDDTTSGGSGTSGSDGSAPVSSDPALSGSDDTSSSGSGTSGSGTSGSGTSGSGTSGSGSSGSGSDDLVEHP